MWVCTGILFGVLGGISCRYLCLFLCGVLCRGFLWGFAQIFSTLGVEIKYYTNSKCSSRSSSDTKSFILTLLLEEI